MFVYRIETIQLLLKLFLNIFIFSWCSILIRLCYHGRGYLDPKYWMWGCSSRTRTCFFNLIGLIEEYGYKSIDYLYYKRRDSLVAIQWDTDVMEMIQENESKKNISLFVTRQRMAIIAPAKSTKEPTKSAPKKSKGSMMNLQLTLLCVCLSIQFTRVTFFCCHPIWN